MGELKSAWQIAQERAERLGRLSEQEKEQQERERCSQIGAALARRWLDATGELDIGSELEKYQGRERVLVRGALIQHLLEAVELGVQGRVERARAITQVISNLEPRLASKIEEVTQLLQEYETAEKKVSAEIEDRRRQILHQLRISGSAIAGINVERDPQWQSAQQKLREEFEPKLHGLKQELVSLLQAS